MFTESTENKLQENLQNAEQPMCSAQHRCPNATKTYFDSYLSLHPCTWHTVSPTAALTCLVQFILSPHPMERYLNPAVALCFTPAMQVDFTCAMGRVHGFLDRHPFTRLTATKGCTCPRQTRQRSKLKSTQQKGSLQHGKWGYLTFASVLWQVEKRSFTCSSTNMEKPNRAFFPCFLFKRPPKTGRVLSKKKPHPTLGDAPLAPPSQTKSEPYPLREPPLYMTHMNPKPM